MNNILHKFNKLQIKMELHQQETWEFFQELRKDANLEAKKILNTNRLTNLPFFRERTTWGSHRWKSSMHSLLDSEQIDYYIQNQMSIEELYDEQESKYNKDEYEEDV